MGLLHQSAASAQKQKVVKLVVVLLRRQRRHHSSRRAGSMVAAQGSEYNNVLYSYGSVRTTGTSSSYFESISSEAFSPLPRHERKNPRRVHGRIRGESPVVRRRLPEYG